MKSLLQNSICLFLISMCSGLQLHAQTTSDGNHNSTVKQRIEVFAQYNINWTPSNTRAMIFTKHYDYYNSTRLDRYFVYSPLLIDLNLAEAQWSITNQPEIGFRLFQVKNGFIYGSQIILTRNVSNAIATTEAKGARAELLFNGSEWRTALLATFGLQFERLSFVGSYSIGLGFGKNYSTQLRVTDSNGNTEIYSPDFDEFFKKDFQIGVGAEVFYDLSDELVLGARYHVNKVSTSQSDFLETNGYWNNSVGLSLAYRFVSNK